MHFESMCDPYIRGWVFKAQNPSTASFCILGVGQLVFSWQKCVFSRPSFHLSDAPDASLREVEQTSPASSGWGWFLPGPRPGSWCRRTARPGGPRVDSCSCSRWARAL